MLQVHQLQCFNYMNESTIRFGDYLVKYVIFQGYTSNIYAVQHQLTSEMFAAKVINKRHIQSIFKNPKYFMNLVKTEQQALKKCDSHYVIKIKDCIEDRNFTTMILQYCNQGSLQAFIKATGPNIHQQQAIVILKQIILGLAELRRNNIAHRDLKPANILKNDGCFKIADLGCAKFLSEQEVTSSLVGSPCYMAPQVIAASSNRKYSSNLDIWSLGVLYFQLLFGKLPFSIPAFGQDLEAKEKILDQLKSMNVQSIINQQSKLISESSKDLIKRCLVFEPSKRLTWMQLASHEVTKSHSSILLSQQVYSLPAKIDIDKYSVNQDQFHNNINQIERNLRQIEKESSMIQSKIRQSVLTTESYITSPIMSVALLSSVVENQENKKLLFLKRLFNNQKNKLAFLLKFIVSPKSKPTQKALSESRKLLELRLMINQRCLHKAKKILNRLSGYDEQFLEQLKARKVFSRFCHSLVYKQILDSVQIMLKKCNKYRNKLKLLLQKITSRFSHIVKDYFQRLFWFQQFDQKQLNLDLEQIETKNQIFICNFIHSLLYKFEKLPKSRGSYQFLVAIKYYQFLLTEQYTQNNIKLTNYKIQQVVSKNNKQSDWTVQISAIVNSITL